MTPCMAVTNVSVIWNGLNARFVPNLHLSVGNAASFSLSCFMLTLYGSSCGVMGWSRYFDSPFKNTTLSTICKSLGLCVSHFETSASDLRNSEVVGRRGYIWRRGVGEEELEKRKLEKRKLEKRTLEKRTLGSWRRGNSGEFHYKNVN